MGFRTPTGFLVQPQQGTVDRLGTDEHLTRMRRRFPRAIRSREVVEKSESPSVLVLQLDSEKLRGDRLDLTPFARAVTAACIGATVEVVDATNIGDLHRHLLPIARNRVILAEAA